MSWTTSNKDFELFCSECNYWIDYFGLSDWSIIFKHDDCIDGTDGGWMDWDLCNKHAEIGLTKKQMTYNKSVEAIYVTAFHEVLELMFVQFKEMAQSPYETSETSIRSVTHSVINKFSNSILKEHIERRKMETKNQEKMSDKKGKGKKR